MSAVYPSGRRSDRPATAPGAAALALLVVAVTLCVQSFDVVRDDLAFTAAETEVGFWGRGAYEPDAGARDEVGRTLDALLAAAPAQPDYLTLAARYSAWLAYWSDRSTDALHHRRRALELQYAALLSRPAYRPGWQVLSGYAKQLPGREARDWNTLAEQRLRLLRMQKGAVAP